MTWQGVKSDSCQVRVGVDVTGIDVSITSSLNLNGDLTLGTLRVPSFLGVWQPDLRSLNQHRERLTTYSSQQVTITVRLGQGICHLSLSIHAAQEHPWPSWVFSDYVQINSTPPVVTGTDCLALEVEGAHVLLLSLRADSNPAPFHSRVHVSSHLERSPRTSPWLRLQRHWLQHV